MSKELLDAIEAAQCDYAEAFDVLPDGHTIGNGYFGEPYAGSREADEARRSMVSAIAEYLRTNPVPAEVVLEVTTEPPGEPGVEVLLSVGPDETVDNTL